MILGELLRFDRNDAEAAEGFSSIFIYRGLPGQQEGRWGNESWPDTMAFLDRAAAVGIRVLFDFEELPTLEEEAMQYEAQKAAAIKGPR